MYWEQGVYSSWTRLNCFHHFPDQKRSAVIEPHYHDNDEISLRPSGRGEVWLNGQSFPITPNTLTVLADGRHPSLSDVHRFR